MYHVGWTLRPQQNSAAHTLATTVEHGDDLVQQCHVARGCRSEQRLVLLCTHMALAHTHTPPV